jgi:hypothetical protein
LGSFPSLLTGRMSVSVMVSGLAPNHGVLRSAAIASTITTAAANATRHRIARSGVGSESAVGMNAAGRAEADAGARWISGDVTRTPPLRIESATASVSGAGSTSSSCSSTEENFS